MNYTRQFLRFGLISVGTAVLSGLLFYVLRILLYGRMSIDEYGMFYSAFALVMLLYPLLSVGFGPGIAPFITRMREARDRDGLQRLCFSVITIQAVVGACAALALVAAAGPLSNLLFGSPDAAALVRMLGAYLGVVFIFRVAINLLTGFQFVTARHMTELVRVLLCVGAAWVVAYDGAGAAGAYVLGTAAAAGAGLLACAVYRSDLLAGVPAFDSALMRKVFAEGMYTSLAFGGVTAFAQLDTLMLNLILRDGGTAAGAYQVAVPTLMIIYALLFALAANFMPMVTAMVHRGEQFTLGEGIATAYRNAAGVVVPACILAAVFADVFIEALFRRPVFEAPGAFSILAIGAILTFFAYFNLHVLAGLGWARAAAFSVAAGLFVNVLANLTLIPWLHIRGAAWATVLSYAVAAAISLGLITRKLPVPLAAKPWAAIIAIAGVCGGLGLIVRAVAPDAGSTLAGAVSASGALYIGAVFALEASGSIGLRTLLSRMIR